MSPGTHRRPSAPTWRWALVGLVLVAAAAAAGISLLPLASHRRLASATPPSRVSASTVPVSPTTPDRPSPSSPATPSFVVVPEPRIVQKPIPFPQARKDEMASYAKTHYGIDSWHIVGPQVIVEHFTATTTFAPVWSEFAIDAPDYEFHVLPADCAHFVIDADGTIYQLVPVDIMCRHTVGLNWTAIGIEMVGTSDRQILSNPAELHAALSLTLWLADRFHIQLRNVIGHAESLDSPYHKELVSSWRCQTHADWQHADMQTFRSLLRPMMTRYGLLPGPAWVAHPQAGC
jgi:N-acetylmuramoyl-L-alanine amidase